MAWTKQQHETLARMAPDHSAREIAKALGITRNGVLGRAHRYGISINPNRDRHAFARGNNHSTGGRRGKKLPEGHPATRSRPRGSHAFSLEQRAAALAARMAGASWRKSAELVGASAQILAKHWSQDPSVIGRATELFNQARAEALRVRLVRQRLLALEASAVAQHNARILSGWGERNRRWVERKLKGESLAAIAADFGVTRERVRQVLMRAVEQGLRSPPGVNLVRDRRVG